MELQERIILEAGSLFARYGIRSITMDALAEDMGISKRTIYENFKDKDELLFEVIKYYKQRQMKEVSDIITNSDNIITAMFKLLNNMVNNMKQLNPLFFQDIKKYHSHLFMKIQEKGDIRDHSITKNIFEIGKEQGIIRPELNIEIINITIHEMFNMFTPDSKLTTEGYHRGELFNNIIIPYLVGICTDKGRELIAEQETIKY